MGSFDGLVISFGRIGCLRLRGQHSCQVAVLLVSS